MRNSQILHKILLKPKNAPLFFWVKIKMEKGVFLEFEKIDDTFAEYGLWQAPLKFRDQKVPFKAILKEIKGKPRVISIVGRGYKLLPKKRRHI